MRRRFAMHSSTTAAGDLLDAIEIAREARFDALEIGDDVFARHLEAGGSIYEVREALAVAGIEALSYTIQKPLALPERSEDIASLHDLHHELCERAAALGVGTIVVRSPERPPDRTPWAIWRDTAARTLASVSRAGEEEGVRVALELLGTGRSAVRTLADAREVAHEAMPPLALVIDAFDFHAGGSTLAMLEDLDMSSVVLVRLTDAQKRPLELLGDADRTFPGDGVIAMRELLRRVEDAGYRGPYSIELGPTYRDAWPPLRIARVAIESIEGVCAEQDERAGLLDYD